MLDSSVRAALAAILPPSALLTAPEDTKPYECDGLTLYRELPAAVLLPDTAGGRPMALGFVYQPHEEIDPAALVHFLQKSVQRCTAPTSNDAIARETVSTAAACAELRRHVHHL